MEPRVEPCIGDPGADTHFQSMSLSPACGLRRGERLIRSAAWRWRETDHRRGDINEDDESSGPRCNWRGIGPRRSGRASSGAVVGKSRHRHYDPGRFEGFHNRSTLASPLASALASPLVDQSDTIFAGPLSRARFLSERPVIFDSLRMMTVMCPAADAEAFAPLKSVT